MEVREGWRSWRRLSVIGSAALVLAACSGDQMLEPTPSAAPLDGGTAAHRQHQPKVELEIRYMKFAIDHHGMGFRMAGICTRKAIHRPLVELCERNREDQSKELDQMQRWLLDWYGISYRPVLSPTDEQMLDEMKSMKRPDFEMTFLKTFSRHHHMIVERSRPVAQEAAHAKLRAMAAMIVEAQTRDIRRMLRWLCDWYGDCKPRFGFSPSSS